MRNKKRIPICLELFLNKEILLKFLNGPREYELHQIYGNYNIINSFWLKNPDLRFGQLLINLGLAEDGHYWFTEETDWLVNNGYCKLEDINFWGVNFFKNGKQRKHTKHKLLKDLADDHIENIIKYFEEHHLVLKDDYRKYFENRLNKN
jgi:hypothetical protein